MYHQKTKDYLKGLAVEIRSYKNERKPSHRKIDLTSYQIECIIEKKKYEYRHYHIAYCKLKGTAKERIETPRDNNKPNEVYISQIEEKISREYAKEQAICNSQE